MQPLLWQKLKETGKSKDFVKDEFGMARRVEFEKPELFSLLILKVNLLLPTSFQGILDTFLYEPGYEGKHH